MPALNDLLPRIEIDPNDCAGPGGQWVRVLRHAAPQAQVGDLAEAVQTGGNVGEPDYVGKATVAQVTPGLIYLAVDWTSFRYELLSAATFYFASPGLAEVNPLVWVPGPTDAAA